MTRRERRPGPSPRGCMLIAAGGTGGHMFPAMATAGALRRRGWQVEFLSDSRGARYVGDRLAGIPVRALPLASPWRGGPGARVAALFRLGRAAIGLVARFLRDRPACVIAFGGYATAPALLAATLLGIPRMVHEQNAILGRVNRVFLRLGARLACGVARPPDAPSGADRVGVPVRPEVAALAGREYRPPAAGGEVRVLVVGGSQGSRAVARLAADALARAPAELRQRLEAVFQVRDDDREAVGDLLAAASVRSHLAPFLDDLPARMAACHLVVARAGASTLAELSAIGRPAVVIPLPTAAADHQSRNAEAYARSGAARVFRERGGSAAELGREITALLGDADRLVAMATSAAAGALATGAAGRLAALAEDLAGGRATGRTGPAGVRGESYG